MNYDVTQVGVPYAVVTALTINWPDSLGGFPTASITQKYRVTLADGTTRDLEPMQTLAPSLDFVNNGNTPIPLINPMTGVELGQNTSLNTSFEHVVSVIRSIQLASGQ